MYFVTVVSTTVLLLAAQALALKYTDCGSQSGKILDVRLTGCEDTDICEVKRGERYTYGLTFESLTNSEKLRASVYGIVNGVTYPYPLPNNNACETEDIDCPIKNGEVYDFGKEFEVTKSAPVMRVDVKWVLQDDNGVAVVCGIVPVKIV